jgi:molybdopterin molybdotransferase
MKSPGLISVDEARTRLFGLASPVGAESVPVRQAAGRWAAADIVAQRTQPAVDLSAMDGYAIRFDDLPGPFTRIGESAAGRSFDGRVGAGETVRIFTGAAIPAGADTVIVQEEATLEGSLVRLSGAGPATRGRNTRRKGLDFKAADILVAKGDRLTSARLAVAATGGHGTLSVNRRLRVATVATGDELVTPGTAVTNETLPESNGAMLQAMLADMPVDIIDLGILPDRLDVITKAFARVDADILVTTGGASVGDHDLVRPALEAAGGTIAFWRIALRPGKPMMAGRLNNAVVLGLPGNPVSAFVTALLFLKPLVASMAGARDPLPRRARGILGEPLAANDHRADYLRAETCDGLVVASTIQDSSMLRTLARADCLIIRPPHAPEAVAGESVEILPLA